jgi:hypothetical protein
VFLQKIRRAGERSNIITIPIKLEKHGYIRGAPVILTLLDNGNLLVVLADREEENIKADNQYAE